MTNGIKRQDPRKDPLVEWVVSAVQFLRENRKLVLAGIGGLVVVCGVVAGYWLYQERQEEEAGRILASVVIAIREEQRGSSPDQAQAIKRLREVIEKYPRTRRADEALIAVGSLENGTNKNDEALKTFDEYLGRFPRGRFVFLASLGKAYAQEAKGNLEGGARTLSELLERYKDDPLAGEAYSGLARLYEELKKTDDAMRTYSQITERYPQSQWARHAVRRMGVLKK